MPTEVALAIGTRSVILSFSKEMTNISSRRPATSCSSIEMIRPTPCAGYTTKSFGRNSVAFFALLILRVFSF